MRSIGGNPDEPELQWMKASLSTAPTFTLSKDDIQNNHEIRNLLKFSNYWKDPKSFLEILHFCKTDVNGRIIYPNTHKTRVQCWSTLCKSTLVLSITKLVARKPASRSFTVIVTNIVVSSFCLIR